MSRFIRICFIGLPGLFSSNANSQPVAAFTADITSGCAPLTVNFTDQSSGIPNSWYWDFGNGNSSFVQHPSTVYPAPGHYSVKLVAGNLSGSDSIIKTNYIQVLPNPVASFVFSASSYCTGSLVLLDDSSLSVTPLANWQWFFGDGNVQNNSYDTASHVYLNPGTYPVTLFITDTAGCSDNVTQNISINPDPVAAFDATPRYGCEPPLTVNFINNSIASPAAAYFWDFGDGSTSTDAVPAHTYTSGPNNFNVFLRVTDNFCKDSLLAFQFISIYKPVSAFTADTFVCIGDQVQFTNLSSPLSSSMHWEFGDGDTSNLQDPVHYYQQAGTFTAMLVVSAQGCSDSALMTITVVPYPTAAFTLAPSFLCQLPDSVSFTNTSVFASSYFWDFGDQQFSLDSSPVHTYTDTGFFNVTLVAVSAAGCSSAVTVNNAVHVSLPHPSMMYFPSEGCIPLHVVFTSTSTSWDPIVSYFWDFGNGDSSSNMTDSSDYTAVGVYPITLTIVTALGCTATAGFPPYFVQAGILPQSGLYVPDTVACVNEPLWFYNQSSGTGNEWIIDFGNGVSVYLNSPDDSIAYEYPDTGYFAVTLVACHNGCCDTSVYTYVTILPPMAAFSSLHNCQNPLTVSFIDQSHGDDSLVWYFGDGNMDVSNNQNPVHTYAVSGLYTVSLVAYNYTTGCSDSAWKQIYATVPVADFVINPAANGCNPLIVTFNDASQWPTIFYWDFGDGTTSTEINPTHIYNFPGVYTVSHTIWDPNLCPDSVVFVDTIKVFRPSPLFYADTLTGCVSFTVTFSDSTTSLAPVASRTWNFGDGTIVTNGAAVISHTYLVPGLYTVTLQVVDTAGCAAALSIPNYINASKPIPSFLVDSVVCLGESIYFNASATVANAPLYEWDFGDGSGIFSTTSSGINHTYFNNGSYTVTLLVTDPFGCDSTITKSIAVTSVSASFSYSLSTGCGFIQIQFTDNSQSNIVQWLWDFGNGSSSVLQNPLYTYTVPGYYDVSLIVTDINGCKDTAKADSIMIAPNSAGSFSFSPQQGCIPLTVNFTVSTLNASYFIWDFGDGTVITTTTGSVVHTYSVPITVTPQVILVTTLPNGNLCQLPAVNLTGMVDAQSLITVSISHDTLVLPADSSAQLNSIVTGGSPGFTYQWTPSQGLSDPTSPSPTVTSTGEDIIYYLIVTDANGCTSLDSVLVRVQPCDAELVPPNIITPNGDGLNDEFEIKNLCVTEDYKIIIFNRWGNIVYESGDTSERWKGKDSNGNEVSDGVYYYLIFSGERKYTGFVHVIRDI